MKKSILMAALGLLSLNTIAQDTPKEEGFIFTTVKENPITSVKNQNRAGTCWCYSGLAFIESELLRMGKGEYDFSEMFIVHKENNPLWKNAITAIHDIYLGERPEKFTYKGKEYTPKSFYESTGLNADDYISLTSYTHHPFYQPFVLEIQDNWRWASSYNLPIDELMEVFDNAINKGYTIAWGSDVSEQGFTRDGIAVMPDAEKVQELSGSDMAHWLKMKPEEKKLNSKPQPQKWCTQEERQLAYDNWETTDDHGMLIYGIAKDQEGNEYYMVKNSWGEAGKYKGLWYASKAFVRYKTMNIIVHKDALPKEIAKKLGIK